MERRRLFLYVFDFPDNLSSSLSRLNKVIPTVPKKKKTAAVKKRVKKASKKKSVKKKVVKIKPLRFTRFLTRLADGTFPMSTR